MRPTLAAEELKTNLTQYLSTTFALADPPVREALESSLIIRQTGSSAGRTCGSGPRSGPPEGWRDILEWVPELPFRTCTRCRPGGDCRAWTASRS